MDEKPPPDGLAGVVVPKPLESGAAGRSGVDSGAKGIEGLVGVIFTGRGAGALAGVRLGAVLLRVAVFRAGFLAALREVVFFALVFLTVVLRAAVFRAGFLAVLRAAVLRAAVFFVAPRFTLLRAGAFLLVVRFFPLFFVAMALLRF